MTVAVLRDEQVVCSSRICARMLLQTEILTTHDMDMDEEEKSVITRCFRVCPVF